MTLTFSRLSDEKPPWRKCARAIARKMKHLMRSGTPATSPTKDVGKKSVAIDKLTA